MPPQWAATIGMIVGPKRSGKGTIGQALLSGAPGITSQVEAEPAGLGAEVSRAGLKSLVALPVVRDGRLVACMAWYF